MIRQFQRAPGLLRIIALLRLRIRPRRQGSPLGFDERASAPLTAPVVRTELSNMRERGFLAGRANSIQPKRLIKKEICLGCQQLTTVVNEDIVPV